MSWASKLKKNIAQKNTNVNKRSPSKISMDRKKLLFLLTNFQGCIVEIQLTNLMKYDGVFHKAILNKNENQFILKQVRQLDGKSIRNMNEYIDEKVFDQKDLIYIKSIDSIQSSIDGLSTLSSFKTDTEISNRQYKERNLQRWTSDDIDDNLDDDLLSNTNSLDGNNDDDADLDTLIKKSGGKTSWDQFAQQGIGEKSYSLDLYTTKIDESSEFYKKNIADAIKLEQEMLSNTATNRKSDKLSEEALYSTAFIKKENQLETSINGYKPPSKRTNTTTTTTTKSVSNDETPKKEQKEVNENEADEKTSSKKLNPAAKEFKFSIKAKSFEPKSAESTFQSPTNNNNTPMMMYNNNNMYASPQAINLIPPQIQPMMQQPNMMYYNPTGYHPQMMPPNIPMGNYTTLPPNIPKKNR